ncbi:MAG: SDR family NAD(P)-dependent oxidoreductase [Magnetococcales bacterium]|nr:SDR family NAD(P)-dependent oxidoreductase [Magnetococcales bacterium]
MDQGKKSADDVMPLPDGTTPAVIGMGIRFPGGVADAEALWHFLLAEGDGIVPVPAERWNADLFAGDSNAAGRSHMLRGGFLDRRLEAFDAAFFGISPREAVGMDPQQRLLLEVTWEALENAGIPPDTLTGQPVGVYMGGLTQDMLIHHNQPENRPLTNAHSAVGMTLGMLANRISHVFDWRGPSLTVDTACSSSLTALHLACAALRAGQCTLAVVGGVNLMFRPNYAVALSKGGFLSPSGESRVFEAECDGYVRGEGAGVIVLRRLEEARALGDRILGLIRATGINQDGRTPGITVPRPESQSGLIRAVCAQAAVDPRTLALVEAHGTGTQVGDAVEAASIGAVMTGRVTSCPVTSIKSNIGHLEAAAGMAGLMRALLALHHRQTPPQRLQGEIHPAIVAQRLPIHFPRQAEELGNGWLLAGVNSFGYGGSNAFALLSTADDGATCQTASTTAPPPHLLLLSARDPEALRDLAAAHAWELEKKEHTLSDWCRCAAMLRQHLDCRLMALAKDRAQMVMRLRAFVAGDPLEGVVTREVATPPTHGAVWVFSGMGTQWHGMARDLLTRHGPFRQMALTVDRLYAAWAGWSILDELQRPEADSRLAKNQVAQPALFLIQAGLVAEFTELGLTPGAVVGASMGEVAAAWVAGCLTLEQAVELLYHRTRVLDRMAGAGAMLAAALSEEEAALVVAAHDGLVEIAVVNGPGAVVLAGDPAPLATIADVLASQEIFHRYVAVEVAYHTHHMEVCREPLLEGLRDLNPAPAQRPLYSTVTGDPASGVVHDAAYWWRNVREPVRFDRAMRGLVADGYEHFVEISAHGVLLTAMRQLGREAGRSLAVLPTLRRDVAGLEALSNTLGELHLLGHRILWERWHPAGGERVDLPRYPWRQTTHWTETRFSREERFGHGGHPLLARRMNDPLPTWETDLNNPSLDGLRDHRVHGEPVLPAAACLDAALAAWNAIEPETIFSLGEFRFMRMVRMPAGESNRLRVELDPERRRIVFYDNPERQEGQWSLVAEGRFQRHRPSVEAWAVNPAEMQSMDRASLYAGLAARGLEYREHFQRVQNPRRGPGMVCGELSAREGDAVWALHPALLDGGFQLLQLMGDPGREQETMVIAGTQRLVWSQPGIQPTLALARITARSSGGVTADLQWQDEHGQVVAEVNGLIATPARRRVPEPDVTALAHVQKWLPRPLAVAEGRSGPWLVVTRAGTQGEQLAGLLDGRVVHPERLDAPRAAWRGILFLDDDQEEPELAGCNDLLRLIHWLDPGDGLLPLRLVIATREGQAVAPGASPRPRSAALWGMGRVAMLEYAPWQPRLIDLETGTRMEALAAELAADDGEREVALKRTGRFVSRLVPLNPEERERLARPPLAGEAELPCEAVIEMAAGRRSLVWRRIPRPPPGPGEVELRVLSTALAFKDHLKWRGLLTTRYLDETFFGQAMGMESLAEVVAVGAGVEMPVGQRLLVALPMGGLRTHATLEVRDLRATPVAPEWDEGICFAFSNLIAAHIALEDWARVRPGEWVLIHSAATGVGLAMLAYAALLGARLVATAGSEARRAFLHDLGVEAVFDSRSLEFVEGVRRLTGGRGVDVVVNSRPGEAREESMALLAPFGRFVELIRAENASGGVLPAALFRDNVAFLSLDMDRLLKENRAHHAQAVRAVLDRLRAGEPAGLERWPCALHPMAEVEEALASFADAGRVGRSVVNMRDRGHAFRLHDDAGNPDFLAGGSCLITGGLTGVGLEVARLLADSGVRDLVLVGRRGMETPGAVASLADLRARGAEPRVVACDIADPQAVTRLFAEGLAGLPPLTGVFHAAVSYTDALLARLDEATLERLWAIKVRGAALLDRMSRGHPLRCFVLFSSLAALTGSPGQGGYAAANEALAALANRRHAAGLPALCVDWGVIDAGIMTSNARVRTQSDRVGFAAIPPEQLRHALRLALRGWREPRIAFFAVDWRQWRNTRRAVAVTPRYAEVMAALEEGGSAATEERLRERLARLDVGQQEALMADVVCQAVGLALGAAPERLHRDRPLVDLGLDSLMAVELSLELERRLECRLTLQELTGPRTVHGLARELLARLTPPDEGA